MSMRKILSIVLLCVVVASLEWCSLGLFVVGAQPCESLASGGTIELKWDDGIALDRVSFGCPSCYVFQGVQFTLPEGLSKAVLKSTRVYAGPGKATLGVYITDASFNYLIEPRLFAVRGTAWYEVPLPDVLVPDGFYIWIKVPVGTAFQKPAAEPYYDGTSKGHSFHTDAPGLYRGVPQGDFMIRAVVLPVAHVGPGQDYSKIQEAIDSIPEGWTIVVHDGTYRENVTVNKSLTIKSLSGPAKTVVKTPDANKNAFTITAGCVMLSGFTIQGALSSGVKLADVSGCVISGNVVQNALVGISISKESTRNIVLENECKSNYYYGISIQGSENYVSGNNLHGNKAQAGAAVYLSADASGNQLRFNTITVDEGTYAEAASYPQVSHQNTSQQVSAVENWWGTDTGPSNAGGQGPAVGEGVLYDPWLTKQPLRVHTSATSGGDFAIDAKGATSTVVFKQGAGEPIVSTARFGENPLGEFPGVAIGEWVDVLFSSTDGIDQVEIRQYYTADEVAGLKEGSLRLLWWNGEKWKVCSKTGVVKTNDFVWARLNLKSRPTSSDLTGTMFAVGIPRGGGFAWWLIPLIIAIVIVALIAIRLFWVLVVKRERYT